MILRSFRTVALAATALSLTTPVLAGGDDAAAWARWTEKANAIVTVYYSGPASAEKRQQMKTACSGTMGMMIGHSYPMWAQGLIGLCRHIDDYVGEDRTISRGAGRGECQEMKYVRGQFNGAKDVPGSPDVLPVARKLAEITNGLYDRFCTKDGRKAMRDE